ncbi:type II toxin-antitoxin system VapC family toxin [Streptomyces fulvoviolaceus]|uniref:type II toxin-antitoxin system VapC family toxin n=1 Tax=Streptomyces fulvoviolaceus TaxID=285535 RepID=UPI0021C23B58|nr:type II toxin-antitoxin system VapC family toxin [Streptomyces fulvoviolaceus]MCT9075085.1 type II toxin-antitoxin system VapC family toxin [Streptomyces fulvoviolaceus]
MIYLDSCALLKLLLPETETDALRAFLSARAAEGHVTSALSQTEVFRALVRADADPEVGDAAEELLDRLLRIRITDPVLRAAGMFPVRDPRSLDAIHLASAEYLEHALTAFVTYDKRLAAAAVERGLPVEAPGAA